LSLSENRRKSAYAREFVATAGAARADREVVADQLAAAAGENSGGRLIKHARYYWLLLAKSHLTRRLFARMLRKIGALPVPAG
jgi:hypothetical protein